MSKLLIDTNVLCIRIDGSSVFHQKASHILRNEGLQLFTTTKNLSAYFAVCTKLNIDSAKMFGFYGDLQENITFLYPDQTSLNTLLITAQKVSPKRKPGF